VAPEKEESSPQVNGRDISLGVVQRKQGVGDQKGQKKTRHPQMQSVTQRPKIIWQERQVSVSNVNRAKGNEKKKK